MRTLSCGEYSSAPKTKSCDRSPELLQLVSPQSFLQSTQSPSSNPYPVLTVHISDEFLQFTSAQGLLRWCSGKESTCNAGDTGFDPWVGKIPLEEKWQPTPVFLPEKSHGQRSLVGYGPWGSKESDKTEQPSTRLLHQIMSLSYLKSSSAHPLGQAKL